MSEKTGMQSSLDYCSKDITAQTPAKNGGILPRVQRDTFGEVWPATAAFVPYLTSGAT
jgi:hypothetical protein